MLLQGDLSGIQSVLECDNLNILMNVSLILIGVLLFGLIIFSHEFGHFFTAKLCGIRVNEFALGMGPKIFSKVKGETRYSLRLLPIGGYCAMEGEDEESNDNKAFGNKPVWQRMIVLVAGGAMNILLGMILMAGLLLSQDQYSTTQVSQVGDNSPVQLAGLQSGDIITKIDDYKVYTFQDISFGMGMADHNNMSIEVNRDGQKLVLNNIGLETVTQDGNSYLQRGFNLYPAESTFWSSIRRAPVETYSMVRMVLGSLKGLVTGQFGLNDLAGPVGTAQVISEAASAGLSVSFLAAVSNIVLMIVLISVNLGIVNLLPLPALDGGRLVFLLLELIFRKPVPAKYEGWVHTAGFVLLIGIMLLVTFNDIVRLVGG